MGVFFFGSTHFLGFPTPVFVILSIQAHPHIQHFDSGFLSFFHISLAFFIISIIPLLPLVTSNHLTSNWCHQFLNILPASCTCFLILIIFLFSVIPFLICSLYIIKVPYPSIF
jgi:hypothetical protein